MYESLLEWCRFPVNVHTRIGTFAGGDPKYDEPYPYNGYRVDQVTNIVDKDGEHYVSMTQVYFPPAVPVTVEDVLSFEEEITYEIRKIGGFYDGNDGTLSILVVYL